MDGPRKSHEGCVERLGVDHVYGRDVMRRKNTNGWHETRWANSSNTTVVYAVIYSHDTCLMTWSSSWRSVFSLSRSLSSPSFPQKKKKLNSFSLWFFSERERQRERDEMRLN